MDIYKIISELHKRLKHIDEVIAKLEALEKDVNPLLPAAPRKRGRPPKNTQKRQPKVD